MIHIYCLSVDRWRYSVVNGCLTAPRRLFDFNPVGLRRGEPACQGAAQFAALKMSDFTRSSMGSDYGPTHHFMGPLTLLSGSQWGAGLHYAAAVGAAAAASDCLFGPQTHDDPTTSCHRLLVHAAGDARGRLAGDGFMGVAPAGTPVAMKRHQAGPSDATLETLGSVASRRVSVRLHFLMSLGSFSCERLNQFTNRLWWVSLFLRCRVRSRRDVGKHGEPVNAPPGEERLSSVCFRRCVSDLLLLGPLAV